jgi:hypothetical protein
MSRSIDLKPINQATEELREQMENAIEYTRQSYEENVKLLEQNYQLAALLDAAGIDLTIYSWQRLLEITIDLGVKPTSLRAKQEFCQKLNAIRKAVGSPLKVDRKYLACSRKNLINVVLVPQGVKGVEVRYQDKLPKGEHVKCKIVKRRVPGRVERQLVCEM